MGRSEYDFGFASEDVAARFLQGQGFEILERNFHSKFGEIDIIARKGGVLRFVEVKATQGDYEAVWRLTRGKMRKLTLAIAHYILRYGIDCAHQIDLVCVEGERVFLIENVTF